MKTQLKTEDMGLYVQGSYLVDGMLSKIEGWKGSLRKEKRKLVATRIDKLSNLPLTLKSVSSVVENQKMWKIYSS